MTYEVLITPAAEAEVAETFEYIRIRSPMNARRWLQALYNAIEALAGFHGYGRAPESDWLDTDLRQKVFKSHRIIYSVDQRRRKITVHFVRHGARRRLGESSAADDE